jgi:hypothetical protein
MGLKKGTQLQAWASYQSIPDCFIYVIKVCIMENIEKGYTVRNIYILSDSCQGLLTFST